MQKMPKASYMKKFILGLTQKSRRPKIIQMATDRDTAKLAQPPRIFCSIENIPFKVKIPSHVSYLNDLAYQVRQKRSLRRLAVEKPTRGQVASDQSRIKMTDAGGGDCKIHAKTRRQNTQQKCRWLLC